LSLNAVTLSSLVPPPSTPKVAQLRQMLGINVRDDSNHHNDYDVNDAALPFSQIVDRMEHTFSIPLDPSPTSSR
jgi:hypothetical protein